MIWLTLALKNTRRRPGRTLATAAGVAIAIAALFSLLCFQRGYHEGMQGELDRLGAHVLVVPKGCPYDAASIALHGARWPCYLKGAYLEEVRTAPAVSTAAPVFMSAMYGPDGENIVYVGVEPTILHLKRSWTLRGAFPERPHDLLAGAEVARKAGWQVGQDVALPGLPGKRGRVAGILAPTAGADDTFIYTRLADAQRLFDHPEELTHILVRLKDPEYLERAVSQLRSCGAGLDMNIIPLAHLFRTIQALLGSTRVLFGCIVAVGLLIAGAGVSNALLMAVTERSQEIGRMRALGASRADIFQIFWLETVLVCLVGGVVGLGLAFGGAHAVEAWVRAQLPFSPPDTLLRWEWPAAAFCMAAGMVLGSLAGVLPAWRAAHLSPMDAIRGRG